MGTWAEPDVEQNEFNPGGHEGRKPPDEVIDRKAFDHVIGSNRSSSKNVNRASIELLSA